MGRVGWGWLSPSQTHPRVTAAARGDSPQGQITCKAQPQKGLRDPQGLSYRTNVSVRNGPRTSPWPSLAEVSMAPHCLWRVQTLRLGCKTLARGPSSSSGLCSGSSNTALCLSCFWLLCWYPGLLDLNF